MLTLDPKSGLTQTKLKPTPPKPPFSTIIFPQHNNYSEKHVKFNLKKTKLEKGKIVFQKRNWGISVKIINFDYKRYNSWFGVYLTVHDVLASFKTDLVKE